MNGEITFRWVDGPTAPQEEWDRIDDILASRGWMSLNRLTTRLLLAERDGEIVGLNTLQLLPHLGPLYVRPAERGTSTTEQLVDRMLEFMAEAQARGFLVISESPYVTKICEAIGMQKLERPVYVMAPKGDGPSQDS